MPFIQVIEYKTSRIDELNAALDGWLEATKDKGAASCGVQTKDRDATNTYVQIVEFPSYEEAMANSNLPETSEFAARLASLCEGPPSFLDYPAIATLPVAAERGTRHDGARHRQQPRRPIADAPTEDSGT